MNEVVVEEIAPPSSKRRRLDPSIIEHAEDPSSEVELEVEDEGSASEGNEKEEKITYELPADHPNHLKDDKPYIWIRKGIIWNRNRRALQDSPNSSLALREYYMQFAEWANQTLQGLTKYVFLFDLHPQLEHCEILQWISSKCEGVSPSQLFYMQSPIGKLQKK